jgi:hypothetical protein
MASTNVPSPTFGPTGFVAPAESAILAGVQADINTAFGGVLDQSLTTPQGQLAQSETAIVGDANNQFLSLANGVDPAFAAGRMQDAIGRIYFITRNPALPTVLTVSCVGLAGVVIPANNALIQDSAGNVYSCTDTVTIPVGGSVTTTFACTATGPIAVPATNGVSIYQAIPGWDTVTCTSGVVGQNVETRSQFEYRRSQSVAVNAQGSLPSVLGAVFSVANVLDAYATENVLPVQSGAAFTGSISGTTLTVSAVASGTLAVGQTVVATGVAQSTLISALGSGTGGTGTYALSISQTVSSESMVAAVGGVPLGPNSLYVGVSGGLAQSIGQAIWTKKSPGCNYNGNTSVTVFDQGTTAQPYSPPLPQYIILYQALTNTTVLFSIAMQNNPGVPANAVALVQAAVLQSFTGADNGPRARVGSWIFSSRFYANIAALGPWALIYSIQVGVGTANANAVLMQINQEPVCAASNISVTFS